MLLWNKGKESNVQRVVGVFFLPCPQASFGSRNTPATMNFPRNWLGLQVCIPKPSSAACQIPLLGIWVLKPGFQYDTTTLLRAGLSWSSIELKKKKKNTVQAGRS